MQHLVGVVEQPTWEGVVDVCGGRLFQIWFEQRAGIAVDDVLEQRVVAEFEQVLDAFVPLLPLDGVGHEVV